MKALFIIVRGLTMLSSLSSLILLSLVLFLRDTASTAKQGVQVLGYVTKLFASAFTEGTAPQTTPFHISAWQIAIGALAIGMLISAFTPGSRGFLHAVALLAAVVMIGYVRMIFAGPELEIVCLPFLVVWFGYYAMNLCCDSATRTP